MFDRQDFYIRSTYRIIIEFYIAIHSCKNVMNDRYVLWHYFRKNKCNYKTKIRYTDGE